MTIPWLAFLAVAIGIGLLWAGGEALVAASARLAVRLGMRQVIIGLTVVAFATSAPELAATITAALRGSPDLAIGNAFGSNVANLGLILGISTLLHSLTVEGSFLRREMAYLVVATIAVFPLMLGELTLGRVEGAALFALLVFFLWRWITDPESQEHPLSVDLPVTDGKPEETSLARLVVGIVAGGALLVGGAQVLVWGAIRIAETFHVPERVIGLTLVAIGTSLPELAASVVAARRDEGDLILGNLVGSNIFNLLCILGLTALIHPIEVSPEALRLDYWMMLGITLLILGMLVYRRRLSRLQGGVLLVLYAIYTVVLF